MEMEEQLYLEPLKTAPGRSVFHYYYYVQLIMLEIILSFLGIPVDPIQYNRRSKTIEVFNNRKLSNKTNANTFYLSHCRFNAQLGFLIFWCLEAITESFPWDMCFFELGKPNTLNKDTNTLQCLCLDLCMLCFDLAGNSPI